MKTSCLHPLIRMHIARCGGHRPEKKIHVEEIDGDVRNMRVSITAEEPTYKEQEKGKPKMETQSWRISTPCVSIGRRRNVREHLVCAGLCAGR